ncbi:MAG: O-antigen ligase family protein [Planctomycetes bacterium]|nr:O-antigen ligase family protein [Planctomycetota bacterium]MCB9908728.1 O-antigen ligase family protein [Planctomycetota bacterium]MCB9912447.1 O-antigen ligase family protein [Planctomycetota bacterium]
MADSPTTHPTRMRGEADNAWDRALPTLIVLPTLLLAALPLLRGTPATESAGPAWWLLAFLPAAFVWALSRGARGLGWMAAVLWFMALYTWVATAWAPDPFEAQRASVVMGGSALAFALGSSLSRQGRFRVWAGLAWLPTVLLATIAWNSWQGWADSWAAALALPLGNRSDLVEFAWPGVVAAMSVFLTSRNRGRALWLLITALAFALGFGVSPVYAAVVALLVSCAVTLLFGHGVAASARLGRLLLVASALAMAAIGIAQWNETRTAAGPTDDAEQPRESTSALEADRAQGLQVRLDLWHSTLALIADHPMLGVGPGQFSRSFPPYRSAEERERSSHQGEVQNPVEVEHAHNDPLMALAEWGIPLGGLWLLVWGWVALSSGLALRTGDSSRAAAAAVAWGYLAWGVWNAPLLGPVYSHGLAWLVAGMAVGRRSIPLGPRLVRGLTIGIALSALAGLPAAGRLAGHGYALAQALAPRGSATPEMRKSALTQALEWEPDSSLALEIRVHGIPSLGLEPTDSKTAVQLLDRLVQIHPFHRGLWNDRGVWLAREGALEAAQESFEKALSLDPHFGPALVGRVTLLESGSDLEALRQALVLALAEGAWEPARLLPRAYFWLGQGFPELAAVFAKLHNPELDFADANVCFQQSLAAEASGDAEPARMLREASQQLFGRDAVRRAQWSEAVVNYRQALRLAPKDGQEAQAPLALRLEMAAALALDGRIEAAQDLLQGLSWQALPARNKNHMPAWTRAALEHLLTP